MPPLHCNTGAVYRAFDEWRPEGSVDAEAARAAAGPPITPFNDLAEPACRVEPQLRGIRETIAETTGRPVHVTGSGAAMFIVAEDAADAQTLAQRAASRAPALAGRAVRTIALPMALQS